MQLNADSFRAAGRGRVVNGDVANWTIARRLIFGEREEVLGAS